MKKGCAQLNSETIFERLGGDSAINVGVKLFYQKILADPYIKPFFEHVDMIRQVEKQKSFLTKIFDGPHDFNGKDMREAHRHLVENMGLNDSHFDHLMTHLRSSLTEIGLESDLITEAVDVAESFRDEVLNR